MTPFPDAEDLKKLRSLHEEALASLSEATRVELRTDYPEAIRILMDYIISSKWCDPAYNPSETESLIKRIDVITLFEICSLLTALVRSERFSDGSWQWSLKNGIFATAIRRAEQLIDTKQ